MNTSTLIILFVYFVLIISLISVLLLILPFFNVNIHLLKEYSEVINNLGVSIGALLAGVGSLKYIEEHLNKLKIIKKKENYRKRYPLKRLNIDYYLVWFKGRLILFDKKTRLHHHIRPWESAQDLSFTDKGVHVEFDFNPKDRPVISINSKKIDTKKYNSGKEINTVN